jgi:hypothetical protein
MPRRNRNAKGAAVRPAGPGSHWSVLIEKKLGIRRDDNVNPKEKTK